MTDNVALIVVALIAAVPPTAAVWINSRSTRSHLTNMAGQVNATKANLASVATEVNVTNAQNVEIERKIDEVHTLANDRLTKALDKIEHQGLQIERMRVSIENTRKER